MHTRNPLCPPVPRHLVAWAFAFLLLTPNAQAIDLMRAPAGPAPVPGNLLLALSVEYPTGLQASYPSQRYEGPPHSSRRVYEGYFDNRKCYQYSNTESLFSPVAAATADLRCADTELWSGNLLNWLTMTNLDQFRLVMTGGTRDTITGLGPGDTLERTVLVRARNDRPNKPLEIYNPCRLIAVDDPTPSSVRGKYVIQDNLDWTMKFGLESDFKNPSSELCSIKDTSPAKQLPAFEIRVEVCKTVAGVGIEAFCNTQYSGAPKPEGLIQRYADRLRVGALGYLNDSANTRNGGVIRAALQDTRQEWSPITGIQYANPYPIDAQSSKVQRSGLINYVNLFGYLTGYKAYDPISELYYAALLYLRGHALPNAYTQTTSTSQLDGFPSITGGTLLRGKERDPVINRCQKSFVLGVGDMYTHCDGNLPGGVDAPRATCGRLALTDPDNLNVETLWRGLKAMEVGAGTAEIWPYQKPSSPPKGSQPYIAGLAHWANTRDIRSDLPGRQSVRTYWVDVKPDEASALSPLWLAAKYGGFDTKQLSGDDPNKQRSSWDADGDGNPDTWFAGNTPTALRSGLTKAFDDIAMQVSTQVSGASGSTLRAGASGVAYLTGYGSEAWSGELKALKVGADGTVSGTVWDAAKLLDASTLQPSRRKLLTHNGVAATTFGWGTLSPAQRELLSGGDGDELGQKRLAFVEGHRDNELPNGPLRQRSSRLGSLVNSTPLVVTPPTVALPNSASRREFIRAQASRPSVIYIGSNAGMLHAFDASTGSELFAYIPMGVYSKLRDHTLPGYQHVYMVDGSPMQGDAEIGGAWKTVLVTPLGLGGKGYVVLNVTTPTTFSAQDVLLDRSSPGRLDNEKYVGHIVGSPVPDELDANRTQHVVKLNNQRWAVVLGNGVNSDSGQAALLIQYLDQDMALKAIPVGDSNDNGLSPPRLVDLDGNGTVDVVYVGDIKGRLWSFDLASSSPDDWRVRFKGKPLFTATHGDNAQPISGAPYVLRVPKSQDLQVAFGTGRHLSDSDASNTQRQTLYSIRDTVTLSSRSDSNRTATSPKSPSNRVTIEDKTTVESGRSELVEQTSGNFDASGYASTSSAEVNPTKVRGWFMDLPVTGERQVSNTELFQGSVVRFKTFVPRADSDCESTSQARHFVTYLDIMTGKPRATSVFSGTSDATHARRESAATVITLRSATGDKEIACTNMSCSNASAVSGNARQAPRARPVDWRRLQ